MKKRLMACLIIGCMVIGSAIPVSAEESTDVIETTEQDLSSEEETESAEIQQHITEEAEQDVTVDENADIEENKDNAEQEEVYAEITDSVYIEGGNAEDSVSGIQTYSDKVFEGLFYLQLEGLSLEMYEQIAPVFLNYAEPVNFEPDAEKYGLEFEVPAGDNMAVEQNKKAIEEKMHYAISNALAAQQMDVQWSFWLRGLEGSWTYSIETTGGTSYWKVTEITLTPTLYYDNADEDNQKFKKGVIEAVDILSAQIDVSDTWYEIARKVHDWINEQVTYNYDAADIGGEEYMYAHTAYPVFADDKGKAVVCEGYAKAFQLLCNQLGLSCKSISGMAYTGSGAEPHMWNMVLMPDGNYYAVDLTWDDAGDAGDDTYFMVGANTQGLYKTFAEEHVVNTKPIEGGMEFVFPTLAEETYTPDERYYGSGEYDSVLGTYTLPYKPAETMNIPEKVFEEVLDGDVANKITVNIPDLNLSIEGRYNSGNYEFEIPYDVDVEEGIYNTSVILEQTSPGWEEEWTDTKILKVKVEEDMQGVHYVNSFAETDGTKDAVFKFKNGTGANRIVSIDEIKFAAVNGPGPDDAYSGFTKTEDFEYDLDKGTVTIPKEWFTYVKEEFGMSFLPYVYFGEMTFTLESGGQVTADLSDMPQEVPIDEFKNPGDEAWYFIYREPEVTEPDYLPGDIDANGEVNSGDLAYMLQVTNKRIDISELTENQIEAGDVSRQEGEAEGTINSGDLATLLQYINGRIDSLG